MTDPTQSLRQARWMQFVTVVRRELLSLLLRWRGAGSYLLALAPLLILSIHALHGGAHHGLEEETKVFAGIFQYYYMRVGVFFACAAVFTRSIRGEMIERSLHYYLLAPLRRELLVAGKFAAALIALASLFGAGVGACYFMTLGHFAEGRAFLLDGPALAHAGAYLGVTLLACLGYGAVFLAIGILFKNPALPGLAVFGLETWSAVLPSWAQRLTVTHYLKPLLPVEAPAEGWTAILTVVVEPTPSWLAVMGLLLFAAAALAFAGWRVRRLEIDYSVD